MTKDTASSIEDMQRKIKFRVWDKINKRFVTNVNQDSETKLNYDTKFLVYWNNYEFMQFTGLKDKNVKEIYEGDIVKYMDKYVMKIVWNIEGFWEMINEENKIRGPIGNYIGFMEVIGNICENKELIK